jgi:ring-1,2-phenylacetyl-CoA epoxidase subunit PaaD
LNPTQSQIYTWLEAVSDPEIPVLSILDMGIVRDVRFPDDTSVEVVITPTYSGCPAMDAIAMDIKLKLAEHGISKTIITYTLDPAWTTDWMTEEGKKKLKAYGIAPPMHKVGTNSNRLKKMLFEEDTAPECPRCGSAHTKLLSQFGSTACKALYQCEDCKEPFDYFKCH